MSAPVCLQPLGDVLVYMYDITGMKSSLQYSKFITINGYKINRRIYQVMGRLS